jgi:hypothetical protein
MMETIGADSVANSSNMSSIAVSSQHRSRSDEQELAAMDGEEGAAATSGHPWERTRAVQ